MKAAVLHATGEPMRLEDVRLAGPGPGEVLVRVQAAGLLDGTSRLSLGDGRVVHHFLGVSCFAPYCVVAQESVVKIRPGTAPRVAALAESVGRSLIVFEES